VRVPLVAVALVAVALLAVALLAVPLLAVALLAVLTGLPVTAARRVGGGNGAAHPRERDESSGRGEHRGAVEA
jgi:hypothetical protein